MYYDRRVPPSLLDLLLPEAPLGWLLPWLRSEPASRAGAHVQTRRDRDGRRHGGLQLYLGRTSPLELRPIARGGYRLYADAFYRAMAPELFEAAWTDASLTERAGALQAHVERAARETHRSFLDGEAVAHAGLMRRYGPLAAADAPLLALDSEARVGFGSQAEQRAFEAELRVRVGLPVGEDLPRKLDLVALDRAGRLLVVEVKKDASGLGRAAWQAACHVARLQSLVEERPDWFAEVLGGVAAERARVGLLGAARPPALGGAPVIVPVIAAPEDRPGWAEAWRAEIAAVRPVAGRWLDGLRLWRLAPDGEVLEDCGAAPALR